MSPCFNEADRSSLAYRDGACARASDTACRASGDRTRPAGKCTCDGDCECSGVVAHGKPLQVGIALGYVRSNDLESRHVSTKTDGHGEIQAEFMHRADNPSQAQCKRCGRPEAAEPLGRRRLCGGGAAAAETSAIELGFRQRRKSRSADSHSCAPAWSIETAGTCWRTLVWRAANRTQDVGERQHDSDVGRGLTERADRGSAPGCGPRLRDVRVERRVRRNPCDREHGSLL